MRVLSIIAGVIVIVLSCLWIPSYAGNQQEKKPRYTTKQIMKDAHKSGLHKKVLTGQATQKETEQLLGFYVSLWENKPKKGDRSSWTQKTGDVLAGAAKVLLKEEGARGELQRALNCKGCHTAHK